MQSVGLVLLLTLTCRQGQASQGVQPTKGPPKGVPPISTGWVAPPPPTPTVGWNPPEYAPPPPPPPPPPVKQPSRVGASVVSRLVPPVSPPVVTISQKHKEEYHSTVTFDHPLPDFEREVWTVPKLPPILPPRPVSAGSNRYPPISYQPPRFSFPTCTPPLNVLNFNWDSPAYRNRDTETFYTPLSHSETPASFHRAITGHDLRQGQGQVLDDICLTTALNWNDLSAVVTTFGKNKEKFQCKFLEPRNKFALECIPSDAQGEAFRIYFTKSDDRSYLVAYHCWEGGHVEWFTFTNFKSPLPYHVKSDILTHVQTMGYGFSSTQYKETNYERCFPDPVGVPDKYCDLEPGLVQDKNWYSAVPLGSNEVFYMPMAHRVAYNKFNQVVNGDILRGSPNNFCIQSSWTDSGRGGTLRAFYGKVPFICTEIPNYFGHFRNSWVSACETMNTELFTSFVTKTDNRNYRVIKQCWKSGETTWTVYSTHPVLPKEIRQEILNHVASLGFSVADTEEITYEFCETGGQRPTHDLDEQEQDVLAAGSGPFGKCTPPRSKFIKEFHYNSDLYQLRRKEEFYIPLAGKGGISSLNRFISGISDSSLEISRKGFCGKFEYDYRNFDTRYLKSTDQDGRMERLKCTLIKDRNQINLHAMDCYRENGEPVFRSYVTMTDAESYLLSKHCWASGEVTWFLYSAQPEVTEELKQKVLSHVQELGFNSHDYNEVTYKSCPGEEHIQGESEVEVESDAEGSATALFPKCSPPSSFLRRHTWESSSNNQGLEFFDVAMAHPKAAAVYRQSLQQTKPNFNEGLRNCLRMKLNHDTNISRLVGYGDAVSNDFTCTYAPNQEWILECISKSSPALSYRNYGIKSDNLSWILTYQCLNSGATPASWTLWVSPGTPLSQITKSGILQTVESLGFSSQDYVEFGSEKCIYRNKVNLQRTCPEDYAIYV